jgi:hypothetical protein
VLYQRRGLNNRNLKSTYLCARTCSSLVRRESSRTGCSARSRGHYSGIRALRSSVAHHDGTPVKQSTQKKFLLSAMATSKQKGNDQWEKMMKGLDWLEERLQVMESGQYRVSTPRAGGPRGRDNKEGGGGMQARGGGSCGDGSLGWADR